MAFGIVDFLKNNGKLSLQIKEIKKINESPDTAANKILIEKNIREVLNHAVHKSEFYKDCNPNDIKSFSIIDKSIIKENADKLLTDSISNLKSSTTSGSTGSPLTIYQDHKKVARHKADAIFFNNQAGYRLGSKLYYFRVWNEKNHKSLMDRFVQNIQMADISNMSNIKLEELIERMKKDKSNKSILSFASSLEILERYFVRNPQQLKSLNLNCVISISETLPEFTREFISVNADCDVISRYSNMENGFIAQQRDKGNEYYINQASFYVEVLKLDSDAPAENGEMGRIIVTDLFNYGMPIIRYDTGDIGVLNKTENGFLVLETIVGRKVDFIYNADGEVLSPHTITNTMWFYSDVVNQFQFIQKSAKGYEIRLNLVDGITAIDEEGLKKKLYNYLGNEALIEIIYVSEIPVLNSGKRKKIVNTWQN